MMYGCSASVSATTIPAYRINTYSGCRQSPQWIAAVIVGATIPSAGPKCGTNCNTAASPAQSGASGTPKTRNPMYHIAPTVSESSHCAISQFFSALSVSRRCSSIFTSN